MIELAVLRNQLLSGHVDVDLIYHIIRGVEASDYVFRDIMLVALHNCLIDVGRKEYRSAANEIYLIHDLPLSRENFVKWNQWCFYVVQLPSYLDNVDDASRVKQLVGMLADAQNRYPQT